ncbi:hypothetical protein WN51_10147 [Melipona quadrifasciata]|uniref:Uncharacterized protein n=1 Tax=Melipona quadrifasciata TaxID=166423 RepID=A0A0M9A7U2_9HYME|nr:hypothetical protein WN51_10147 [Melipona quadrifasciata]
MSSLSTNKSYCTTNCSSFGQRACYPFGARAGFLNRCNTESSTLVLDANASTNRAR